MNAVESPRDIVLLVDDSPDSLSFLTEALEETGYSVLIATSAASRPRAMRMRPMRGWLLRASKVYQWPAR